MLFSPLSYHSDEIDIAGVALGEVSGFFLGSFYSHLFLSPPAIFAICLHFFDAEACGVVCGG
jgi:hypothetical protein